MHIIWSSSESAELCTRAQSRNSSSEVARRAITIQAFSLAASTERTKRPQELNDDSCNTRRRRINANTQSKTRLERRAPHARRKSVHVRGAARARKHARLREKVGDALASHVTTGKDRLHVVELIHTLLHAAEVAPLGDRDRGVFASRGAAARVRNLGGREASQERCTRLQRVPE
eukprot:1111031-Pleurochrysis_carterae.AAC.3